MPKGPGLAGVAAAVLVIWMTAGAGIRSDMYTDVIHFWAMFLTVLVGVALVFGWLRLALWILAVLTTITALQRLYIASYKLRTLRQEPPA